MALYKVLGTLEGTTPVQLQNPMYQHPSEPLYKIRTPISKKRLKTEEDYITLSRLDFLMSRHWQVGDTDDCDCTVDSNGNVTAFSGANVITGQASSATGTPDASTQTANNVSFTSGYAAPELKHDTGEILYVENRTKIARATDQTENIKLIIEF